MATIPRTPTAIPTAAPVVRPSPAVDISLLLAALFELLDAGRVMVTWLVPPFAVTVDTTTTGVVAVFDGGEFVFGAVYKIINGQL